MIAKNQNQRGSALLVATVVTAVAMIVLVAMMHVSKASNDIAYEANSRVQRLYAAEAGLQRAKLAVMGSIATAEAGSEGFFSTVTGSEWLSDNSGGSPVVWSDGNNSFSLSDCNVQVKVDALADGWYLVTSTAAYSNDIENKSTSIARTIRGASFWSDYARFVSKGVLNIGSHATYGGKVHCNSNISATGSYVKFMDDVTASGKISSYTNRRYPEQDTVFMKNATSYVPEITLPDAAAIAAKFKEAPEGSIIYNVADSNFVQKVIDSGSPSYTPTYVEGSSRNDKVDVTIVFKNNKMDVTTKVLDWKGNVKSTLTETNVAVPDDKAIHCSNNVTVSGNISGRTSVLTPEDISINGPIRYVDDAGGTMWELQDSSGKATQFTDSQNSWSTMGDWTGSAYQYNIADNWYSRDANVDREKPPVLGLMSGGTIYITGENTNREVHAALFTSGDVIRPKMSGSKNNLYINGAIITAGTNPVSSYFSYRCYAYDPNLRKYPPPEFEQTSEPSFSNWHVIQE